MSQIGGVDAPLGRLYTCGYEVLQSIFGCFWHAQSQYGVRSILHPSQTDKSQDDMIPKPFPLDGEGLEIMYVPPDLVCFGCTDARDRASGYGIRA